MNNEINTVCHQCGVAANYLTCWERYGSPPKKDCYDVSTVHIGICDFCNRETSVTQARDFFYPDFDLLKEAVTKR